MAITINWQTGVIFIPKVDTTLVQLTPVEIRRLDTDAFFLTLKDLEASAEGIPFTDTQRNASPVTLGGITYARVLEIIDPYTITFEDGQYVVQLVGSNNNIIEKTNPNQVSVQSNNSAGLIQTDEIQFASFQNGVTVDVVNGVAGQQYPTGTLQQPVNNMADALFIADFRGFINFYFLGDATIDSGLNYTNKRFVGQGPNLSTLTISSAANVTNATFMNATITGVLDGDSLLDDCMIDDLDFISGIIERCILNPGTITLGGGTSADFIDCQSGVPGQGSPVIDMGGSGQALAMTGYSGSIELENKTGPETASFDLASAKVVLRSTVTNGTIELRGVGKLIDEAGNRIETGTWNGGVTILNELVDSVFQGQVEELWQLQGLDDANPMTVTPTSRSVANISQDITGDGSSTTTVTRQ